jgi:hypothetical protein
VQLVPRPALVPGHCIVNLSSEDPGGFVDTGLTPAAIDPRIYVSRQAVVDMGRLFGFPTPDETHALRADVERLEHEVAQLRDQLAEADKYAEAAEYTLRATFGQETKVRQKPGRKPKPQEA